MAKRSSSKGSKYISYGGKRKRISPSTVLAANLLAKGIDAAANSAARPMDSDEFRRKYLPATISLEEVLTMFGETNYKDIVKAHRLWSPSSFLLIALFLGNFGVDRFISNGALVGLLKLVTLGGFCLWSIVDWFTAPTRARLMNWERLQAEHTVKDIRT